jgi:putative FmdB family regulatory protein
MYKVFDFKCKTCQHVELNVLVKPDSVTACQECGDTMTKLVSAPGLLKTNFHDKPKVRDKVK